MYGAQIFQVSPENSLNATMFQEVFQRKQFTGITIKIQDKTVKAHKILLAARSPVFRKLLEV